MNLIYKRATLEDIDILTETRIKALRAANQLSDTIDMSEVEGESRQYYQKSLTDGSHIAYLVFDITAISLLSLTKLAMALNLANELRL